MRRIYGILAMFYLAAPAAAAASYNPPSGMCEFMTENGALGIKLQWTTSIAVDTQVAVNFLGTDMAVANHMMDTLRTGDFKLYVTTLNDRFSDDRMDYILTINRVSPDDARDAAFKVTEIHFTMFAKKGGEYYALSSEKFLNPNCILK